MEINSANPANGGDKKSELKNNSSILGEIRDFSWETVKIVVISLIVIVAIRSYVMQPFFVSGKSMEPTFNDGDYLLVDEITYNLGNPDRGDVIIFHYPKNPSEFFIKRVVGLPGETVEIRDNKITIFNSDHPDGITLEENAYLPSGTLTAGDIRVELKNDEYYVLGDNRTASADSRLWGSLEKHFIVGRAWVRAWPLDKFSVFKRGEYLSNISQ